MHDAPLPGDPAPNFVVDRGSTHSGLAIAPLHEIREKNMQVQQQIEVRKVHTLGPEGSNLEAASWEWLRRSGIDGSVHLHSTVEDAAAAINSPDEAVMACAAYPALHDVVFQNLGTLTIVDAFVMPTYSMISATRPGIDPAHILTYASHPAPRSLVPKSAQWTPSSSNSQAALDCAEGRVDACITTAAAAERYGLVAIDDHGPVDMAFTLHANPSSPRV